MTDAEAANGDAAAGEGEAAASPAAAPEPSAAPAPTVPRSPLPWPFLGVVAALTAVAFGPGVLDMVGRWMAEGTYYGHGPFVPAVTGWLIWRRRERLAAIGRRPSRLGLPVIAGSVLLLAASVVEDVHFTQNAALCGVIFGVALTVFGRAVIREIWPALAFLLFMVPLPQVGIVHLTFELKILAARISVALIDGLGVPAVLDGSTIHLPSASFQVDDACSGLRVLIGLLAFATVFAILETSRWRAALTLLLAVPVAVLANVGRILLLCRLATSGYSIDPEAPLHEGSGLVVYAVAFLLLLAVRALPGRDEEDEPSGDATAAPGHAAPSRGLVAATVALLALGATASLTFAYGQPTPERTERTKGIPLEIGAWRGVPVELSPRVFVILDTEDVVFHRYAKTAASSFPVDLYVVHAAESRKVAHPPEICFTGGGYLTRERQVATLSAAEGREIPTNRMLLERGPSRLLVYHWYRLDGKDTPSYVDHQISSLLRRVRRERREASMIRLSTPVAEGAEGLERAEARIAAFASEALGTALAPIR